MKSLFRNLCTSRNVTYLSTDYGERYVPVYSFKVFANKILRSSFSEGGFTALG